MRFVGVYPGAQQAAALGDGRDVHLARERRAPRSHIELAAALVLSDRPVRLQVSACLLPELAEVGLVRSHFLGVPGPELSDMRNRRREAETLEAREQPAREVTRAALERPVEVAPYEVGGRRRTKVVLVAEHVAGERHGGRAEVGEAGDVRNREVPLQLLHRLPVARRLQRLGRVDLVLTDDAPAVIQDEQHVRDAPLCRELDLSLDRGDLRRVPAAGQAGQDQGLVGPAEGLIDFEGCRDETGQMVFASVGQGSRLPKQVHAASAVCPLAVRVLYLVAPRF